MVAAELRYECITRSFLIDECRITEFYSGCVVNSMKHVRSTSPSMMLVNKDLYAVQADKFSTFIAKSTLFIFLCSLRSFYVEYHRSVHSVVRGVLRLLEALGSYTNALPITTSNFDAQFPHQRKAPELRCDANLF
ncbi:hypothetical protein TNCV_357401 [Trichonephila clavipes]|nr:hypothetical protein TNCV_357401 [Trichonephila clavipes]